MQTERKSANHQVAHFSTVVGAISSRKLMSIDAVYGVFSELKVFNPSLHADTDHSVRARACVYRSSTSIKLQVETLDRFGHQISLDDVTAACDLTAGRVPATWQRLAGETAPPRHTPILQWIADLTLRTQHFERILSLVRKGDLSRRFELKWF